MAVTAVRVSPSPTSSVSRRKKPRGLNQRSPRSTLESLCPSHALVLLSAARAFSARYPDRRDLPTVSKGLRTTEGPGRLVGKSGAAHLCCKESNLASDETSSKGLDQAESGEDTFWRRLSLEDMSAAQWESLCDGCGRCCLNKLEDADTGAIEWTSIACRLLDAGSCRCSDYGSRSEKVPDCVTLTAHKVRTLTWLPPSCAYRLVAEGHELYWWHPLVSGDPDTVHEAGVSVRGRTVGEMEVPSTEWESFIVTWPDELPGGPTG